MRTLHFREWGILILIHPHITLVVDLMQHLTLMFTSFKVVVKKKKKKAKTSEFGEPFLNKWYIYRHIYPALSNRKTMMLFEAPHTIYCLVFFFFKLNHVASWRDCHVRSGWQQREDKGHNKREHVDILRGCLEWSAPPFTDYRNSFQRPRLCALLLPLAHIARCWVRTSKLVTSIFFHEPKSKTIVKTTRVGVIGTNYWPVLYWKWLAVFNNAMFIIEQKMTFCRLDSFRFKASPIKLVLISKPLLNFNRPATLLGRFAKYNSCNKTQANEQKKKIKAS